MKDFTIQASWLIKTNNSLEWINILCLLITLLLSFCMYFANIDYETYQISLKVIYLPELLNKKCISLYRKQLNVNHSKMSVHFMCPLLARPHQTADFTMNIIFILYILILSSFKSQPTPQTWVSRVITDWQLF